MNPEQFLALVRKTDAAASSRAYRASLDGRNESCLTFHRLEGEYDALPYSQLGLIGGSADGTWIRLTFRLTLMISGRNLLPVFDSIRQQNAAHLYVFDAAKHDEPEAGEPVITSIEIETPENAAA